MSETIAQLAAVGRRTGVANIPGLDFSDLARAKCLTLTLATTVTPGTPLRCFATILAELRPHNSRRILERRNRPERARIVREMIK